MPIDEIDLAKNAVGIVEEGVKADEAAMEEDENRWVAKKKKYVDLLAPVLLL